MAREQLPSCCLSNCDREIAALVEIKTGHPLKGVAFVQLELAVVTSASTVRL